jgi:ABC-type arginine/histidine transport system permease subunit
VLSVICKPEAVVMDFPAVSAEAVVETKCDTLAITIASADIMARSMRWKRCIRHLPFEAEGV